MSWRLSSSSGEHVHVRAPGPDELALHHWMALFSIEAGDVQEAIHHLGHIIGVTEGEHLSRMKQAVAILEEGDADEAGRIVEEMLAGLEEIDLAEPAIHLTLALSAARVDEADVSAQHVLHFVEKATGHREEQGRAILTLLAQGDLREAEHELEQLLGEATPEEEHEDEAPHGDEEPHEDEAP